MGDLCLANLLKEWLYNQGVDGVRCQPVDVRYAEGTVTVRLNRLDEPDAPWLAALTSHLVEAWGVPVRVEAYPWPSDAAARVREIWAATGAGFGSLLETDRLAVDESGGIVCRFPNPLAERLFGNWGGEARLRQLWPDMPRWSQSTDPVAEAPKDPVVPVPAATAAPRRATIGRGAPPGPYVPLSDLPEHGEATVRGRVFQRDLRIGRDGQRHWMIAITDDTAGLRLRLSERRDSPGLDADAMGVGTWVAARGVLERDKYTDEIILRLRDAGAVDAPERLTDGHDRPRIELHVHTRMSAMDGINRAADVLGLAQDLGHPAVAVVDHGVVQAYPELDALAKKTGVRPLYGVEVHMVDTEVRPLTGAPCPRPWPDMPLVVVDVETTGLSPRTHDVIEIGAVKLVNGEIHDRFHRMIQPGRPISQATREITGIGPKDLADAPSPDTVWPEFFQWAAGGVLTAHNAAFDVGFLARAHAAHRPDTPFDFPVLDTLALARVTLPGLKSYGLGPLSDHLKIPLSDHHRALADAEATAHLTLRLLAEAGADTDEAALRRPHPLAHTVSRPRPVVLLLKNQNGLEALYRLITTSHLDYFHRVPRVPRGLIEAGRAHWLIGSPAHGGEVQDALWENARPERIAQLAAFYDYWEIVPEDGLATLAAEEQLGSAEAVRDYIRDLIALGEQFGKPVPAVSDAHYLRPEARVFRDILAATAKTDVHNAGDALHYRTTGEMHQAFGWLPEPVRDAIIHEAPERLVAALSPVKPVPDGLFAPTLKEAEAVVAELPIQRARDLYGDPLPPPVQERLDKEIRSIVGHGFASIYYIAHRLVAKSLADGYLVGSRGSVGSSLVATLLNITEVNPLPPHYRCPSCRFSDFAAGAEVGSGFDLPPRLCPNPSCRQPLIGDGQDIPFETFLGFEGDKVPDIDLNFSGDYQPEIHRYTEELFGAGHVFRAGTIATIAQKTAYGLVRAWGREENRSLNPATVDWLASGITGVKKTTGQHPGGLMVVPADQDIHRFCPVQRPADDRTSDVVTTHFDYHAIEGRLLKLDLLGHDDPTAIRMLEDLTGIAARDVPFQDPETMSLFSSPQALGVSDSQIKSPVGSLGIPEFGTWFVRNMLEATKPRTFAELVRISGLSHGTEVWTNNAQDLIRQRTATLSDVIATRDDIMIYLLNRQMPSKTAFAISESVRKGKGLTAEQERIMREHGVPGWYIDSCRKITYLFPKAHAAAYVMMGWRIAWFKVHHPLAFYATYFTVRASDFDPEVVLGQVPRINQALADIDAKGNEATAKDKNLATVLEIAREMLSRRFRFYPIDLARSHATRFLMEDDGLLIPFAALPGLGAAAAQNIIAARAEAPFLSVDDLKQRARLTKSVIELLRAHGALDGLGETSQLAFF